MCYIQMQSNIEVDVGKIPGKKVGDTSTEMVSMSRFFFFFGDFISLRVFLTVT